jgi:hypothetical protein
MVRVGVHRAETIDSGWEAGSNINSQFSVNSLVVDSLEERKDSRVQWLGRGEGVELLYRYMAVTDHVVSLELLRCTIVVGVGVHKVTSDHVPDAHLEGELGIGGKGSKVLGEGDLRGGHIARRDDIPNNNTIAAPLYQLLAVRKRLSVAKVDVVVGGRKRGRLLINGGILSIICACRADHRWVESQGFLNVSISTTTVVVIVVIVIVLVPVTAVLAGLKGGAVDKEGGSGQGQREREIFHFLIFIDWNGTSVACVRKKRATERLVK